MDAGRALTAIVSVVVLTLMVTVIFQLVYGAMDVRSEPASWQQWNGYKAGSAFTAVEDAQNTDKTADNFVQRKREVISTSPNPTPSRYICSKELPGFITNETINIVTYMPGKDCLDPSTGLNLTFHTGGDISSLRLDTTPLSFRRMLTEDFS